ncbi:hypothetical protein ACOSQ3_027702 [Xanthoceras sorbifolium]
MGTVGDNWDECSVIGEKGEIGYIDYEDDKSVLPVKMQEMRHLLMRVEFTDVYHTLMCMNSQARSLQMIFVPGCYTLAVSEALPEDLQGWYFLPMCHI